MRHKILPWVVTLSGGLLFFYEFIQLNVFSAINIPFMAEFNIGAKELGYLSSMYFYANAGFLFLAGNLLDRFSTRKLIMLAMLFCTIGTFGLALSHSLIVIGALRFVVGLGGAFCFLGGVRLGSRWFPPKRMALISGLLVTMAMIGGWLAQTPLAYLVEKFGWRQAILMDAYLGIALLIWIVFIVSDRPDDKKDHAHQDAHKLKELGLWNSIRLVLTNRQNWLAGFYTCLLNLPIFLLGALWGSMYLTQIYHFSNTEATFICSMLFIGTIFGSPFMGGFSDFLARRRLPMLAGALISLVIILFIIYASLSYTELCIAFLLLGFTTSTQVISYPTVVEHNPAILTGTAVSIVSTTTLFGGAVMQPLSGWLLDHVGTHQIVNGAPVYSLEAYHQAMLIMPIAFIIAFVAAYLLRETYCHPQYTEDGH